MNKVMDICVEVRKRRGGQSCSKHESQPKNSDLVFQPADSLNCIYIFPFFFFLTLRKTAQHVSFNISFISRETKDKLNFLS